MLKDTNAAATVGPCPLWDTDGTRREGTFVMARRYDAHFRAAPGLGSDAAGGQVAVTSHRACAEAERTVEYRSGQRFRCRVRPGAPGCLRRVRRRARRLRNDDAPGRGAPGR